MTPGGFDWNDLRRQLIGVLLMSPATGSFTPASLSRFAGVRPTAAVRCRGTADVVATLAFAARHALPMAIRSGGHDFAGTSSTTGLLLDLGPMRDVRLTGTTLTVGAGTPLGGLYRELDRSGRTLPGGCGETVGIAGLTLGGGLGLLGRHHGLLCDSLRAATLVLADGRTVVCDADREPDLFWALRGAGHGYLGVVTELTFDTIAVPHCRAFDLHWDAGAAADVLSGWQQWLPAAPDRLAPSLLLTTPDDPHEPVAVTVLGVAHELPDTEVDAELDRLVRAVGSPPRERYVSSGPWLTAKQALGVRSPGRDPDLTWQHSEFHAENFPSEAIAELVALLGADRRPGEHRELDLSPWGGAYTSPAVDATAFPHRTAQFLLKHAVTHTADDRPGPWLDASWAVTRPYGTGGVYPNFPDPDLTDAATAYWGSNVPRLRELKQRLDPTGVLRSLDG